MTSDNQSVVTRAKTYYFDYNLLLILYLLLIYITVNIFFPAWIVAQSFNISLLLLFIFMIAVIPLFFLLRYLFPEKTFIFDLTSFSNQNIKTSLKVFIMKRWPWLFYFGIFSCLFFFLLPNLTVNMSTGGDAGQILYDVIILSRYFSLNNNKRYLSLFGLFFVFLYILPLIFTFGLAIIKVNFNDKFNQVKNLVIRYKIPIIILITCVEFFLSYRVISFFYLKTGFYTTANLLDLFRYPPIFFIIGSILFSIFSYNTFALKLEVFIFMVLSAIFLKLLFDELSEFIPIKNKVVKFILGIGAVLTYLFLPVIIQYTTFYYIAAGIAFAVSLTTWLLIKFLKTKKDQYLFSLIIISGIGSLIERPVTFQILGIAFILIIFFIFNFRMVLHKKYILRFILSLIGSLTFFIANYTLVILNPDAEFTKNVRSPSDFYFPNIINGKLFDYVIRAQIEMGLIGVIAYSCLLLVFILGIYKKNIIISSIFILYLFSYVPYILDIAWEHNVDRFMVPIMIFVPLSIYLLILQILALYERLYENIKLNKISKSLARYYKIISPVTFVIIIFILLVGYGVIDASQSKNTLIENDYLPLNSMSMYLKNILTSQDKVYFYALVTPLWFYFQQYDVKGVLIGWTVWTSVTNQTVDNMISFFKAQNITYFMFTNATTFGVFSITLIHYLIDHPVTSSYEFIHKETIGANSLYLWKVL